jgi:hypothetical protein
LSSCSSSSRHRAGRHCPRPLAPASFWGWPSPARRRGGWRPPFGGRRSCLLRRLCLFLSFFLRLPAVAQLCRFLAPLPPPAS